MAKRELSSTLKNLKFMQRAAPKPEAEEVKSKPDDGFSPLASNSRKCVIITEGNPHPGESKGRISFQNFNPAVDRMYQGSSATPSQSPLSNERENGRPISSEDAARDLKRKQTDVDCSDSLGQKPRKGQGRDGNAQAFSLNNGKAPHKQQKREKKVDWNVLRPPKLQARRSGD